MNKNLENESTKESLLAKSLTHAKANELRSLLMKTVKHLWVLVKSTKTNSKDGLFDVYIANEWGSAPTDEQRKLSMVLATGLHSSEFADEPTQPRTIVDQASLI